MVGALLKEFIQPDTQKQGTERTPGIEGVIKGALNLDNSDKRAGVSKDFVQELLAVQRGIKTNQDGSQSFVNQDAKLKAVAFVTKAVMAQVEAAREAAERQAKEEAARKAREDQQQKKIDQVKAEVSAAIAEIPPNKLAEILMSGANSYTEIRERLVALSADDDNKNSGNNIQGLKRQTTEEQGAEEKVA